MKFLPGFLVFFLTFSSCFAGNVYNIDNEQTHVKFAVKMCDADILMGNFQEVTGNVYFDEESPEKSYVAIEIDPKSARFNKEYHREDHIDTIVKGKDFLNTGQFPKLSFHSTKIEKTSDTTAMVTGFMNLVGKSNPFTMEVTFHNETGMTMKGRETIAFSAYGKFKRSDWGIDYALDRIGIRRIGDEVTVLISATAHKQKDSKI